MTTSEGRVRQARASILGFACNQGFLFALLYLGLPLGPAPAAAGRAGLVAVLVCMIVAFALAGAERCRRPLSRASDALIGLRAAPLAVAGVALAAIGWAGVAPWPVLVGLEGLCLGVPTALLLSAWGRALGAVPIERSVPEVFIGSALGAVGCLIFAALPIEGLYLVLFALPLGSGAALRVLAPAGEEPPASEPARRVAEEAAQLSGRILGGTALYGVAAGAVEAFASRAGDDVTALGLTLFLFVLYCLAALQLYGGTPLAGVRAVLPTAGGADAGPLDGAYRLAVLLMMSGFLFVPLLGSFSVPGESVVLAGYMGMFAVLISLFLAMGRISGHDAALSFARGFAALFAGEIAGLGAGVALGALPLGRVASFAVVALAGIAVLYAYLFLFTDRDLRALSVAVERTDRFEEACRVITADAGLSKREAELLPLALRGRTSERMAAELFISKNTVDTHMRRIYAKCGVHSRQELIDLGERVERELPPPGC